MICKFAYIIHEPSETGGFILTMWYVNRTKLTMKIVLHISFILTMWYVNCIACAVFCGWNISFILTMWYVNKY